jgi:hypothetical protein
LKADSKECQSDEAHANFIAHGATEEQYRLFKAINEHHWPKYYQAETKFVEAS